MDDDDILQQADALIRRHRGGSRTVHLPPLDEDNAPDDDAALLTEEVEEIIDLEPVAAPAQRLKAGLMEALVEQRVLEILPERVAVLLASRLEAAVDERMTQVLPAKVEEALQGRLPEAVEARLQEALPERVRAALLEQLSNTNDHLEGLDKDIAQHLESVVQARVALLLPVRVEEALPARLESALSSRLDSIRETLQYKLNRITETWLDEELPGLIAQEMERFSDALVKQSQSHLRTTISKEVDDILDALSELQPN